MASRRGEMLGWTVGWAGAFLWIAIIGVVLLVRGYAGAGAVGLAIAAAAAALIAALAPWRYPSTPAWKLMLPLYLLTGSAVAWAVTSWPGSEESGASWWWLAGVVPSLLSLLSAGRRRWVDGEGRGSVRDGAGGGPDGGRGR